MVQTVYGTKCSVLIKAYRKRTEQTKINLEFFLAEKLFNITKEGFL